MKLENKTILITGGSAGIGLAAAVRFLELGATVIITGRNEEKLAAAKSQYPALITLRSDAANAEDAAALLAAVEALGGIDILYNNAGIMIPSTNFGIANDSHGKHATEEIEVNYLSVVRLNNLFLPMLETRAESAIINTTSIISIVPSVIEATYSASKAALSFYTQTLRSHLQSINSSVQVFELQPPLVATEMVADRKDKKSAVRHWLMRLLRD